MFRARAPSESTTAPPTDACWTCDLPDVDLPRSSNLAELGSEQRYEEIKNQCSKLISELDSNQNPEAIMMRHLASLPHYHELSGVALELITMIADQRHLCTTDILKKMEESDDG